MRVEEIMSSPIVTLRASATVSEAAKLMAKHNIGSLVIVPDGISSMKADELAIVTERDILRKVVAMDKSPAIPLSEVMSKPLVTVCYDCSAREAADLMNKHNIRRLLVAKDGVVVGIVSLRDINRRLRFGLARELLESKRDHYFRHG